MKRFNFLSVVIAGLLLVAGVGCTTLTETQDDYYSERPRTSANRIYVDDPYRGTVVLERDPWTGRYYEVGSYGTFNNRTYRNNGYGNRNYGRGGYDNGYYGRGYGNGSTGRGGRGTTVTPQQPTEDQKKQNEQNKSDARRKVLGN